MARRGTPLALLELTADERETLERWARRPKSAQALALRCRIVLACAEGGSNIEVARCISRRPTRAGSTSYGLIERWFAELTTKWIKRGTHHSVKDLVASIRTWIANWNDQPKPFVWHKTADEILDSLANYCNRISNSGH